VNFLYDDIVNALRPPQTAQHGIVTVTARTHKHQPEAKRQVQR